jgi:hypothetical protein
MRNGGQTNLVTFLAQMDIASTRDYVAAVLKRRARYAAEFRGERSDGRL